MKSSKNKKILTHAFSVMTSELYMYILNEKLVKPINKILDKMNIILLIQIALVYFQINYHDTIINVYNAIENITLIVLMYHINSYLSCIEFYIILPSIKNDIKLIRYSIYAFMCSIVASYVIPLPLIILTFIVIILVIAYYTKIIFIYTKLILKSTKSVILKKSILSRVILYISLLAITIIV